MNSPATLIGLTLPIIFSALTSEAKKAAALKLDCMATYKVHEAIDYWVPAHYRVPDRSGTAMVFEVLNLTGTDCHKLATHYNMNIILNQKYGSVELPENAQVTGVSVSQGQILETQVQQDFSYEDQNGNLPLFPFVHQEHAKLLGFSGWANSAALYNTPDFATLTDLEKLLILKKTMQVLEYGKSLRDWEPGNSFFELLLKFDFDELDSKKEYLQNLLLVFSNLESNGFTTLSSSSRVAQRINQLSNQTKGTKWQTALQIYQKHPALFDSHVVDTAWGDVAKAPALSSIEIEQYLAHAYETSVNLSQVLQLWQARVLLFQYKESAEVIQKNSQGLKTLSKVTYELTEKSKELIASILAIK